MLQGLSLGDQDAVAVYAVADRHQRGHYLHEVFQRFVANDQRQSFFRRDVRREGDFDIVPPFEVDDNVFQRRVVEDQTRREPLAVIPRVDLFDAGAFRKPVEREPLVGTQRHGASEMLPGDRKSTRLNSSHKVQSRMPSSA